MYLTEIQQVLRSIETQINFLELEIEKLKPKEQTQKIDFMALSLLAEKYPVRNKELEESETIIKEKYIQCLAYLAIIDPEHINGKLLFLARLATGMSLKGYGAERIYQTGLGFQAKAIENISEYLKEVRLSFLVDALILSNMHGQMPSQTFSAITFIANLLQCEKDEVRVTAQLARAVLTDDFEDLGKLRPESGSLWRGKFKHYISENWLVSQRIYCGKIDLGGRVFSTLIPGSRVLESVKNGAMVTEGETFIKYQEYEKPMRTIEASKNGVVVTFDKIESYRNYKEVYIVSCFDDFGTEKVEEAI